MANSILYSEINIVCILILFLLCMKVRSSVFLQEQRRLLLLEIVCNILFLAIDAVWIFVNNRVIGITISVNWILNGAYYILSGLLGYYWFMYSETVQNSKLVREKRYRNISLIPMVVLVILTVVSFKTGWLFYIDAANTYHRGPLYVIQLIASYGYVIFTAAKAFYLSFHMEDYRKRLEMKVLARFVLPTLMAGSMQAFFPGFPILCIGNCIGILYVYMTLQEQLISLDALTKLNNRNQLYQFLSTKLMHIHEEKNLYLLIMDIDYFKSVNDQYGHIEGDRALKIVANSLMKVCRNKNFFISRFGGDEFILICELEKNDSVEEVCERIHQELKKANTPYNLSLSIGYTKYEPSIKNQQEFIERADRELYKIKKSRDRK